MQEVLRTNDMVLVSFVRSLLADAEIPHFVLDNHMSVVEGSLGILARRVLVEDEFLPAARRVLAENGLREHLRYPDA
jgi:Putative prokaryotic signal transducing protein